MVAIFVHETLLRWRRKYVYRATISNGNLATNASLG